MCREFYWCNFCWRIFPSKSFQNPFVQIGRLAGPFEQFADALEAFPELLNEQPERNYRLAYEV